MESFRDKLKREREWQDLRVRLLYEAGFSGKEISKLEHVTHQRVYQRLARCRSPRRQRGRRESNKGSYSQFLNRRLLNVLIAAGLIESDARRLLGMATSQRGSGNCFKLETVERAWYEIRDTILATAKIEGATLKELSELAGLSYDSPGPIGRSLRKKGLFVPPVAGYENRHHKEVTQ